MALECPTDFDVPRLRDLVRSTYERVARDPQGEFHFHRGADYAQRLLGYDPAELAELPAECTPCFAGVGNPFAAGPIRPGDTVLDHACGAGMDLLIAARRAGAKGRAIGVDMTSAMRARARAAAEQAGLSSRVEILAGYFEELPLPDASVDVVLSNGVVNLSPDKPRVFSEIFRVLRPRGRLLLADVVVERELLLSARQRPELWAACIGGALQETELLELCVSVGLDRVRAVAHFDCFAGTSAEQKVSSDLRVRAVSLFARKP